MAKRRFFGLHFDFHAGNEAKVGSRTKPEDIEWYINEANPDFIQTDSKGHPGITSYYTKFGTYARNMVTDNLKIWAETVKKHNIDLYVHYSGIYEKEYAKNHPDQAALESWGITERASVFGNYADECFIPQIKEMIDNYNIDGVWVDGDCWAIYNDMSANALKYAPMNLSEEKRDEIIRKGYIDYLKKISRELHNYKKDFHYISNWAYSSYMPEKPEEGVLDSLSGDYPSIESVAFARYEGRCLAAQKMPWDLMCWSFHNIWNNANFFATKSEEQMKQEASAVLMLGGGFQLYICQSSDGSARKILNKSLKPLSKYIREREFLFEKKLTAQTAVYYSKTARYKKSKFFNAGGSTEGLIGTINGILGSKYSANVLLEYQLDELKDYEAVLVPAWEDMCENEINKLSEYAKNGGNLVIIGAKNCKTFGELSKEKFGEIFFDTDDNVVNNSDGSQVRKKMFYIYDERIGFERIIGDIIDLKAGENKIYTDWDLREEYSPAYKISSIGKGKIAYIPFDFGLSYFNLKSPIKRYYLSEIMNKLTAPKIEINKNRIDISILEDAEYKYINLLNLRNNVEDLNVDAYDEVPPVYDVNVKINMKVNKIEMPLGEEFECEIFDDYAIVKIKKLHIHSVIKAKL